MNIAFCGSRSLSPRFRPVVSALVGSVPPGSAVVTGCAQGADAMVRASARCPVVFRASDFGSGPASFARRSAAMVRSLGAGDWLVGFVTSTCPAGVVPATSWKSGRPASGSWSSLALAAGRDVSILVVFCGVDPVLPGWPGDWSPVGGIPWAAGVSVGAPAFVWSPGGEQLSLF